ncbi:hypothetical protein [Marivita sp. GX14005]|uniref:hypothetical protein n=1 Tax=Marivita sp. GX14005 TaxID=2942276 RepID=UPI00201982CF|nr:hypothetical protein [Marivita sp. GX14005]MCL3883670.1 hypothetical protein [Marivita sp. GX14005]
MAEVTNELILEHLKSIQDKLVQLDRGQRDIQSELRTHKTMLGAIISDDALQDGRIAEIYDRLDRIEARLSLRDQ